MANKRKKLKDYGGFRIVVINGYMYIATKADAPPARERDTCLTFRANDLKSLRKAIRYYNDTGVANHQRISDSNNEWIIAIANTESNGVVLRRAYGDEAAIRRVLVGMVKEDRDRDPEKYDSGTEKPGEVDEENGVLDAGAVYTDYHIDYTAMRVHSVPTVTECFVEEDFPMERDFISIYLADRKKWLKYRGYSYARDIDEDENEYSFCDVCFCEAPLEDVLKEGVREWISRVSPECKQYINDCTEEHAMNTIEKYFNGKPGEQIDPDSITIDTPYGNYWY